MSEKEEGSKIITKVTFWLAILAILFGIFGYFLYFMRFMLKPSDYFIVAIILLLISLDAKTGSTLLG